MPAADVDRLVRLRAFDFLAEQTELHGDVLPWDVLTAGFQFEGQRVPLLGPQGIFKPRVLAEMPLSITTAPVRPGQDRPYEDSFGPDGLRYRYRGTDALHRDNVGLRRAMQSRTPLVYFHGIVPGKYFAAWPVYVAADDRPNLTFRVAIDDAKYMSNDLGAVAESGAEARRAYVTAVTRRRLHQRTFREQVLAAYRQCCALCKLRHDELLDAAHIIPDSHPEGMPSVSNGLALCKLHHAAFDCQILGVRPNFTVHVRHDILEEVDGPMLQHGLQGFHGARILLPRALSQRPDPVLLERRYSLFLKVG